MLDWMKKLFNKEEEKTVMNKEVPAQIESQPKIPRVNHYTEAREAQMASRNAGKCRFPLIPDNGFDEEDVREIEHFEERPVQVVTYEEPSAQSGIKVERSRRLYVEKAVPTYEEPELQYEQEQEPIVKKASVPSKESNRRPFRPTEMISPIYGYNRPSVEKKVVQEEEKEREDLEISIEGTSVVEAWLEKKGYTLSDFSAGKKEGSSNKEELNEQTQKNSEVKEKSVVDAWLEKNGYEVESQVPSLEKSQSDQLLHKTVGQLEEEDTTVQALQQEQDVVELSNKENNEETLQEESIDSKVENVETILREEIECSTEIEETVAEVVANQVEEESSEDVVIVTTDEKLQETITIEIPDAFEEELEEATEEAAEEVVELEATEEAIEEVAKLEGTKEEEPISQETVIEETMNTDLVENTPVAGQPVISQQETITFKEESEVFVPISETDEQTKKDVQNFANVLIEEAEEKKQVAEEQPALQIEEPKREKKRHVPFNVVMLKQDRKKLMERHAARTNVMQSTASERVEEKPVQQMVVEPQMEEKPMQQVVVEPQVEGKPMQQVVVKQVQEPISSTEVQEKAYVVNQRENDMRNVLQTPPTYAIPPLTLLSVPQQAALDNTEWLEEQKELLNTTFNNFHVGAHVINVSQGPAVTRFEVQPDPGVKVNKITNLSDDIKLSLAAKDIRIEAPIPGKSAIGIEVPNKESKPVFLREILRSPVFTKSESPLTVALGLDISGDPIVTDIRKMPHGLIAGATGSGKSVCINAILTSILYKAKPHEVKLMLIDPKMVELAPYNSVPHLVAPVITDVKAATAALKWAVEEMERRYELFAHAGARDLTRYNTIVSGREIPGETLPYIVIVIDELADLMMVAPGDVEEAICRIAQKARACGIHLLVATQRPSVDVITGLIKSNIPTRIAFTVSSQVDSRTIIDIGGAEKLLGRGDMLFLGNGTSKPVRVQGVYVSDDEIEKTVDHVRKQMKPNYLFKQEDLLAKTEQAESEDELFFDACQFVVEQGGASTSSVQRKFRIGYNRAARLIEEMESQGIISEGRGTKPRDVLISEDEFAAMQETNV
ncbi:cell division protein FtsK [Bacillus cereus]|nr:cell division protein FtsK [Bacillus cereus]